jgi:hypothetical protein
MVMVEAVAFAARTRQVDGTSFPGRSYVRGLSGEKGPGTCPDCKEEGGRIEGLGEGSPSVAPAPCESARRASPGSPVEAPGPPPKCDSRPGTEPSTPRMWMAELEARQRVAARTRRPMHDLSTGGRLGIARPIRVAAGTAPPSSRLPAGRPPAPCIRSSGPPDGSPRPGSAGWPPWSSPPSGSRRAPWCGRGRPGAGRSPRGSGWSGGAPGT